MDVSDSTSLTEKCKVATIVAESADRYLIAAYGSGIHRYDSATIKVFDLPGMAASE
jgi:hypothetical protein